MTVSVLVWYLVEFRDLSSIVSVFFTQWMDKIESEFLIFFFLFYKSSNKNKIRDLDYMIFDYHRVLSYIR